LHLAGALFAVLAFVFLLTASGHIYIADGETAYQTTESLVERGTLALLPVELAGDAPRAVRNTATGIYGVTAPLHSVWGIPFYLIGRAVAGLYPPVFQGYFTRFFVVLLNSVAHALTCAFLYMLGRELGYRRRTSLLLAIVFAFATIAWPYSRTFYSDTMLTFWLVTATWALFVFQRTGQARWISVFGLCFSLGVLNKYIMFVAAPAFAIYWAWGWLRCPPGSSRGQWLKLTLRGLWWIIILFIGALFILNVFRFGHPLETGYTGGAPAASTAMRLETANPLLSLYGLFFSAGKGLLFYSPPVILALGGLLPLWRRRSHQVTLIVLLALVYPLFYSFTKAEWYGGGNWGARHVMCITPYLILLLGAFLERHDLRRIVRHTAVTVLFIIGFWVQVSVLAVNYNRYLFSDQDAMRMLYYPQDTPLAAQWRLWPRLTRDWLAYDHEKNLAREGFYALQGDLYDIEIADMAPFGRWIGERAVLRIYAEPYEPVSVRLRYSQPAQLSEEQLQFTFDGLPLTSDFELLGETETDSMWLAHVIIPAALQQIRPGTLQITTTTWIPSEIGDTRSLGYFLSEIMVEQAGRTVPYAEVDLYPPLPVTLAYPWGWKAQLWFYEPYNAQFSDLWINYIWTIGLPPKQALAFIIVYGGMLLLGLFVSAMWFARTFRRVMTP
jgi:4-amino-4-deoxy-L-arabinose transferase-like glycosyltransferase